MIKKKLLTLIILTLSMVLLCSCGNDEENTKEENKEVNTTPTVQDLKLTVDKKYKGDEKVTLSSKNDSINVYMPTDLVKDDKAVIVYPFTEDKEAVEEISGKNYNLIDNKTKIDAVLAKENNGVSVYYYFCEGAETATVLEALNPGGTIIEFEHKGLTVKSTGIAQDGIFTCCSVFNLSYDASIALILEGDHEFTDKEIKSYIDRLEYK